MSLKENIEKYKEGFKSRVPVEAQETMQRATEDLKHSDLIDRVIKIGDKAPDFTLKDTAGQDMHLYHLLNDGPVVLTFYRGKW